MKKSDTKAFPAAALARGVWIDKHKPVPTLGSDGGNDPTFLGFS